jgi:hypothetical protein
MAEADLKRLGNAIRTFREQAQPRRISQFRLAVMMNWEGTAPIVEIEKGRRLPRPETLNALGEALQLSPADIALLHGLAGYRETTVMPPVEQIKRVLQSIEADLARRPFPVYVMDYQFRFWLINSATLAFQGGSLDFLKIAMKHGIDGISMSFDSRLPFYQPASDSKALHRETLFRFKSYNIYRRHEPFYLAYPEYMEKRLLPEDYAHFERCWHDVDVRMQDVYPINPKFVLQTGSGVLVFNIHIVEITHLNHLFFAAYYEPQDDGSGNREKCEAYFAERRPKDKFCIRAWDEL